MNSKHIILLLSIFAVVLLCSLPAFAAASEKVRVVSSNNNYKNYNYNTVDIIYHPPVGGIFPVKPEVKVSQKISKTFFPGDEIIATGQNPTSGSDIPIFKFVVPKNKPYTIECYKANYSKYPAITWDHQWSQKIEGWGGGLGTYEKWSSTKSGYGIVLEQEDSGGRKGLYVYGVGFSGGDSSSYKAKYGLKDFFSVINGSIGKEAQRKVSAVSAVESLKRWYTFKYPCDEGGVLEITNLGTNKLIKITGWGAKYKYKNEPGRCGVRKLFLPGNYKVKYTIPPKDGVQLSMEPVAFTVFEDESKNKPLELYLQQGTGPIGSTAEGNYYYRFSDAAINTLKSKKIDPSYSVIAAAMTINNGTISVTVEQYNGKDYLVFKGINSKDKFSVVFNFKNQETGIAFKPLSQTWSFPANEITR